MFENDVSKTMFENGASKRCFKSMFGNDACKRCMEPHGLSFGDTNHETRPHPDPKPCGASWGRIWRYKPYTQATPRPQALWSPMGFHLATQTMKPDRSRPQALWEQVWRQPILVVLCWFSHSQGRRFKSLAAHRPKPHPGPKPYGSRCGASPA